MSETVVTLPAILDIQAAEPLKGEILAARGQALRLDGGQVERLGGLCLQVVLSARKSWENDGQDFRIDPVSEAFSDQWVTFGAPSLSSDIQGPVS